MFTPERHLPTPGQRRHSPGGGVSPKINRKKEISDIYIYIYIGLTRRRHTAAGTDAPTTTDTGNTVPQRANPTQTAYRVIMIHKRVTGGYGYKTDPIMIHKRVTGGYRRPDHDT